MRTFSYNSIVFCITSSALYLLPYFYQIANKTTCKVKPSILKPVDNIYYHIEYFIAMLITNELPGDG